MALKRERHDTNEALEDELKAIDENKEPAFTWNASRAPNASDKNHRVWFHLNGSNLDMYVFNSQSGTWKGPTTFS